MNDSPYCPMCGTKRTGAFRFCRSCRLDFDLLPGDVPAFAPEPSVTAIWAGPDVRVAAWVAGSRRDGARDGNVLPNGG